MLVQKAFKFRLYPNQSQQAALAVQFGHARFVYNHYRAVREGYYLDTGTGLSYRDCADDLSDILKVDYPWLKEADSQTLQQVLKDLERAYKNFFEGRAAYPNFKSKHDKQAIRYPQRFKLNGKKVYLPKVGWVKGVFHRNVEGALKNCTVSKTKSGRYFVSIQCELEVEQPEPKAASVGIDLGLKTFVTLSNGEKFDKPKHLHKAAPSGHPRLKLRQRRVSRKGKGSNSRNKARLPLVKLHERVANQRKDYQHKLSRQLVDRFGSIAFESLNVSGMVQNHKLAKAISDAAWGQFVGFCEYKAKWANAQVLRVDRFFASSQICAACGTKHKKLTLNIRQWACLHCGSIHDRDENAAKNILNNASREATATVGATESHAGGEMSELLMSSAPEAQAALALGSSPYG